MHQPSLICQNHGRHFCGQAILCGDVRRGEVGCRDICRGEIIWGHICRGEVDRREKLWGTELGEREVAALPSIS